MIALTNHQLALVMTAAAGLSAEKRSVLLERVAARLALRGRFETPTSRLRCARPCKGWCRNQPPDTAFILIAPATNPPWLLLCPVAIIASMRCCEGEVS
jgi:hypothetical protein